MRLTDDGHQGVEVANVETLPGNVDEELDHLGPLLLLRRLQKARPDESNGGVMTNVGH